MLHFIIAWELQRICSIAEVGGKYTDLVVVRDPRDVVVISHGESNEMLAFLEVCKTVLSHKHEVRLGVCWV